MVAKILSNELKERVRKAKKNNSEISLAALGERFGISPLSVSQILDPSGNRHEQHLAARRERERKRRFNDRYNNSMAVSQEQ
jgi:hypothetical protein